MLSPLFSQAASYETPSPGNNLKHQNLSSDVHNDGFINHYQIVTKDSGLLNVATTEFARERLHELDIIDVIEEIKQTDAFMKGFEAAVDTTLKATEQALKDPEQAVKNLGKGFSQFVDSVGSTISDYTTKKGVKGDKKSSASKMIKEFLGVNSGKRKLAVDFGVDPFTSNEVLQKGLDELAMAVVAGGASLDLAMQSAPGAANAVRTTAQMMEEGSQHYLLYSPKILKFKINEHLANDSFRPEQIDELLNANQCSLRHAVTIAGVLVRVGIPELNQEVFSWALGAEDENECRRRMHMMELAWDYRRRKKFSSLWVSNDQLYWRDTGGREGIAIVADNLVWTSKLEKLIAELKSIHKIAWVSGQVSDRTASEMSNRGITLSAKRFSRLKDRQNIGNSILAGSELPELEQMPVKEAVVARQEQIPASASVEDLPEKAFPGPEQETVVAEQVQNLAARPVEELTEEDSHAPEQNPVKETVVAAQEQSPVSKPVEEPILSPSSTREPEQAKKDTVKKSDCWEYPKLGRFIFTTQDGQMELTHDIVSKNESRHFKLTTIGKQYYWKTNNAQHVFTKYRGEMTLSTNIYKNKNDIALSKCRITN